jgi:rubrerythrin
MSCGWVNGIQYTGETNSQKDVQARLLDIILATCGGSRINILKRRIEMAVFFSGSELLEIAMGIERNGMAFYQALADKTGKKDIKDIYNYLAGEEKKHLDTFKGMSGSLGQVKPPETYGDEYMLYLKSLVDGVVFSNVTEAKQKAGKISNEIEALDTGILAEKDSILFYMEFQNLVRERDRKVVLKILDEEKNHLRQLSELKRRLT